MNIRSTFYALLLANGQFIYCYQRNYTNNEILYNISGWKKNLNV